VSGGKTVEIITANELVSGAVVYLDESGRWVSGIGKARLFSKDEADVRDRLVAAAKANGRLVGVEIEKVSVSGGIPVGERLRTRIRSDGATAPYGPQRQNLGEDDHVSL
jgi:Protein of unknown function (DUF2849)